MSNAWIVLFLLLSGAKAFLIHNTQRSLCLEDTEPTGDVLLKECDLDSESQKWVWVDQSMLMSLATSRCLSAQQREPIQTRSCDVDIAGLMWDCDRDRLISRNTSMMLSVKGRRLTLSQDSKNSKWKSLDKGDICQEKLRSRRASVETDEFEVGADKAKVLTEEEKEYLRWYYRIEDPTIWKFVLLGLAFVCLLIGFLLLGMGAMASKNRKKIAKYKAAAALACKSEVEELRVISQPREDSPSTPSPERLPLGTKASLSNGQTSELKAGEIMVTWKDGNTSCLYPDTAAEAELSEEEKEAEAVEEKQEETSTVELETHEEDEIKE
ncbi:solute carrier family 51 subunit beta [Scomber scombrus]|uniref:Solute carrier family 51 subunit beta n=1 Tax=Scomber scombrus TaxID=13677 RepID=A0AAV1NR83_SCOSC